MSAPVLSPAERDEVLRFEIHEEDTLAGDVMCEKCVDAVAATRVVQKCPCRVSVSICGACRAAAIFAVTVAVRLGLGLECGGCGHRFIGFREWRDVLDEVPL